MEGKALGQKIPVKSLKLEAPFSQWLLATIIALLFTMPGKRLKSLKQEKCTLITRTLDIQVSKKANAVQRLTPTERWHSLTVVAVEAKYLVHVTRLR